MLRGQIDERVRPFLSGRSARLIPAANFHLTLAFLGSVAEEDLLKVVDAADRVSSEAFEFTLDHLEFWRSAQIACLAIAPTPAPLAALVERLRFNLLAQNVEADQKEFKGHVTIARDWRDKALDKPIDPLIWSATEFVLVESRADHAGSHYTILNRWPLDARTSD
jgi:2'-5' RNA ligase